MILVLLAVMTRPPLGDGSTRPVPTVRLAEARGLVPLCVRRITGAVIPVAAPKSRLSAARRGSRHGVWFAVKEPRSPGV
jgi:hypothetical protein